MPLDDKSDTSSASWGACYDAHSLLLLSHLSTSAISWSLNFNCSAPRALGRGGPGAQAWRQAGRQRPLLSLGVES